MTWSGWDIAIVVIAVLNLALLGWAAVTAVQIWSGLVQPGIGEGKALVSKGKTLATVGKRVFQENRTQLTTLWRTSGTLRNLLRKEAFLPELPGATITISSLLSFWQTTRTVRGGWRQVSRFLARRKLSASASPTIHSSPARPGLAQRLGLVPPAARHLGPILRVARTARSVWSELRRRGVL